MTTQEIIDKFFILVDDTTELLTSESLNLAQKIYNQIISNRPWEFLKKEFTGATNGTTTVTLPADFAYMLDNQNYTDSSIGSSQISRPCVVFVGTNYQAYRVVNWSDRMQYRTNNDVCWVDILNGNLVFAIAPSSGQTVIFDYAFIPATLTLVTSPVFPARFHDMIAFGMASDDMAIQIFDKAKSYAKEHESQYMSYMSDMAYYNSNLQMN